MNITLESTIERTARVMQLEGMFDLQSADRSRTEIPLNLPDLSERDWNVGLIVGPSGAGKSTVARHLFGDVMTHLDSMQWDADKAVVDAFPRELPIREVTELLSSVGFSSPPAWLRPFHALSNGEQFRVTIARLLSEQPELAVVDEFTSVVDRTVAQIGSAAIAKTVRRRGQKFVAVGCHYDVQDWLQPDWVYQPHLGEFTWGSVQPRPRVSLEIRRASSRSWVAFSRHHYLSSSLPNNGKSFVALVNGQPAAFCCVVPFPHATLKNTWRVARIVVLPDFQGIGLARTFLDAVAGAFKVAGLSTILTSGHPAMVRALNNSKTWLMTSAPRRTPKQGKTSTVKTKSVASNRLVASFKYVATADDRLADLLKDAA